MMSAFNIRETNTILRAGYFTMQLKLCYHRVTIGDGMHAIVLDVRTIRLVNVRLCYCIFFAPPILFHEPMVKLDRIGGTQIDQRILHVRLRNLTIIEL